MNFWFSRLILSRLPVPAWLGMLCVLLVGCASPPPLVPPDAWQAGPAESAVLLPGDEVDMQVFREPELSGVFRIGPDGNIRHPLLGDVQLAQRSPADAEAYVTSMLAAKYLVNPRVILKAQILRSSQILLMGEVRKPGAYPLIPGERTTLLQAVAEAGGFTELASPNRVHVVRTVNGKRTTIKVRVADVLAGKARHPDLPLEPNDVIVIPQIRF